MYLSLGLVSCDRFVTVSLPNMTKTDILLSAGWVTSCTMLLPVAPHCPTLCV